ncbi:MAG: nitrite reductase small subunit NirD [Bryobacterales bacterium]|nr:nitrite reductase small subunit NirD [Bryobacterales bacterium]
MASGWIRITAAENIPPREGRAVKLGNVEVAIFNLGGRFVALENRCPHRGGPLADGIVSSQGDVVTVTCPLHNWRISVESGRVVKPGGEAAACLRTFEVDVVDGIVTVRADQDERQAAA